MAASPSSGPRAAQPATDRVAIGGTVAVGSTVTVAAGASVAAGSTVAAGDAGADPGDRHRRNGNERLRRAVVAGHRSDAETARALADDPDPAVRAAALGALDRLGAWDRSVLSKALADADPAVRRRAVTIAGRRCTVSARGPDDLASRGEDLAAQGSALLAATADPDPTVAEAAAWAVGELPAPARPTGTVEALATVATTHDDPLCREAAVAALGAVGDPAGLPAVLQALDGKPPLRRRAAVALAAFDDPTADDALRRCLADHDWQVREVAEELIGPDAGGLGGTVSATNGDG